jgi:hypothetical protein
VVRKALHEVWTRMSRIAVRYPSLIVFLEMHHHASYLNEETTAACKDLVVGRSRPSFGADRPSVSSGQAIRSS